MRIQDIVYVALFAALTAVLGLLPRIDFAVVPVPITAQSMGPMLAGSILGWRRGGLSQALFVLLVAIGLPVLTGGRGGLGIFAGTSAGFVLGFPVAAAITGVMTERFWGNLTFLKAFTANLLGGVVALYACGVPVLAIMTRSFEAALGAAIFLPGDCLKAAIAALIALFVMRGSPLIEPQKSGGRRRS
jgi:biotin transport system substrate-specific component